MTKFKYLGQTTHVKDTPKEEINARIRAAWSSFGENKGIVQDRQFPISLKNKKKPSYGQMRIAINDLWLPKMVSYKQLTNKLRTGQRAMERNTSNLKLQDKIPCSKIGNRTELMDIIKHTLKQNRKWAGHIARMKDNS